MRKSLFVVSVLAVLLLTASLASAQSFSVFGGAGIGSISLTLDGSKYDNELTPGLALQVGGLYQVTDQLGVGVMYDRVANNEKNSDLVHTLSGFAAVAHYNVADDDFGFAVFGGVGSYTYAGTDKEHSTKFNPGLGFVLGVQADYAFSEDISLLAKASYRSASSKGVTFTDKETGHSITPDDLKDLKASAGAWSVTAGIVYQF